MAYGCKGTDFIAKSLCLIDNDIKLLSSFNGKLFGDFVTDVIISRMNDPKCDIAYSQVNIWFNNQNDADKFINEMKLLDINIRVRDRLTIIERYDSLVTNILLAYYIIEVSDTLIIDYPSDNYTCYYLNNVKTISITDIIPKHDKDFNSPGRHFFNCRENAVKAERESLKLKKNNL